MVWREHGTSGRIAYARIGQWPGTKDREARAGARRNATRATSPSQVHAGQVWEAARIAASRSVAGNAAGGVIDLAMVSALGGHIANCPRCERVGPYDSVTPAQWLTWAVRCRPALWRVFRPVLIELTGKRGGGLRRVPSPAPTPHRGEVGAGPG